MCHVHVLLVLLQALLTGIFSFSVSVPVGLAEPERDQLVSYSVNLY